MGHLIKSTGGHIVKSAGGHIVKYDFPIPTDMDVTITGTCSFKYGMRQELHTLSAGTYNCSNYSYSSGIHKWRYTETYFYVDVYFTGLEVDPVATEYFVKIDGNGSSCWILYDHTSLTGSYSYNSEYLYYIGESNDITAISVAEGT